MAVPVINPNTSILAYRLGEYFAYQPSATNNPTSWAATGLPAGMSINAQTGLIEGTPAVEGFYNVTLVATNASGDSAPLVVPVGVEAVDDDEEASIEVDFDFETGVVTRTNASSSDSSDAVVFGKRGDQLVLSVGIIRAGTLLDLPMVFVHVGVKENEPDPLVVINNGQYKRFGVFDTTRYKVVVDLAHPALANVESLDAVLSNYEADTGTGFDGLGEIQLTYLYSPLDGAPMQPLVRSSRSFDFRIERNEVPVPFS